MHVIYYIIIYIDMDLVSGHLSQTARDLAERLGPAGGRVGHHGDVHAHVAHVLGERDAGVDRGLARRDLGGRVGFRV